jgi:hypothetical protein
VWQFEYVSKELHFVTVTDTCQQWKSCLYWQIAYSSLVASGIMQIVACICQMIAGYVPCVAGCIASQTKNRNVVKIIPGYLGCSNMMQSSLASISWAMQSKG